MKLSNKQQADLDSVPYFIPQNCLDWKAAITDADIAQALFIGLYKRVTAAYKENATM